MGREAGSYLGSAGLASPGAGGPAFSRLTALCTAPPAEAQVRPRWAPDSPLSATFAVESAAARAEPGRVLPDSSCHLRQFPVNPFVGSSRTARQGTSDVPSLTAALGGLICPGGLAGTSGSRGSQPRPALCFPRRLQCVTASAFVTPSFRACLLPCPDHLVYLDKP